ncbi:MAG: sulfatase-like hydrolase/transferase, partial [Verrucomicrobiota bacterium]
PGEHQSNAKYAAMVQSVDDSTAQIYAVLDELNLTENTLIIFTSDNGGLLGRNITSNLPLRSGKGYAYEGGIRVPLLVSWPSTLPRGITSSLPTSSIDLFPTILDCANIPLPNDRPIDGLSLKEHLISSGSATIARDHLLWHFPHYRHAPGPYSIIRQGDWKLIHFHEGIDELFDLKNDLGETTNLAESHLEKVDLLKKRLFQSLEDQEAKLPKPNPDYRAPKA